MKVVTEFFNIFPHLSLKIARKFENKFDFLKNKCLYRRDSSKIKYMFSLMQRVYILKLAIIEFTCICSDVLSYKKK
jgi:hypothetical protein